MLKTEKLEKTLNWLLSVSLALLALSSLVFSISGLSGIALPDWLVRTLGVVGILSLPVTIYSTVKKMLAAKSPAQAPKSVPGARGTAKKIKKNKKRGIRNNWLKIT